MNTWHWTIIMGASGRWRDSTKKWRPSRRPAAGGKSAEGPWKRVFSTRRSNFRPIFAFFACLHSVGCYSAARCARQPSRAPSPGGSNSMPANPMSKAKTVAYLAEKCDVPKKTVAKFFEELFKLSVKECKSGSGKFVVPGLARVVKAHRKARMGRNPRTGEPIKI